MKSVRDIPHLENVPVLVRAALNVPVENGKVTDTFRLESALPTIEYLRKKRACVILISHITGKGTETLRPMYEAMKQRVPHLTFCSVSTGEEVRKAAKNLLPGHVLMLENLRRDPREEKNDKAFAEELASLAEVFVEDDFDVCHRKHASVVGIPEFLPSYAGFLVEREVEELSRALTPEHPALAVISGAKFSTKEPVLKKLLATYDHVYVGGALGNDFIKAKGFSVGSSLVSSEGEAGIKELLSHPNLITPLDAIVAPLTGDRSQGRVASLSDIQSNEAVLDAGPQTVAALVELVNSAKTILWNGPLGLYEHGFIDGTRVLARAIVNTHAYSVIGGGDTVGALDALKYTHQFSFVSTGGGAMLDFIAYGTLPGIEVLA